MSDDIIERKQIPCNHSGLLSVYIQGSLAERSGKTVFLTVHDVGSNHTSFVNYVNHPSMAEAKQKSIFLHVCLPGQEDGAEDLKAEFPSLENVSHDLVEVLDALEVKTVMLLGVGAGANIVCRLAMHHPNRVYGVVLVKCTSTTAGAWEYIKDKYINLKLETGMTESAYQYLVFHRFGPGSSDKKDAVTSYTDNLKSFNSKNLAKFLMAFVKRSDLSGTLAKDLKVDALLVVGSKASHLHTVHTMHQAMNPEKTTLLVVDGVGDVMSEAEEKLTRALVLFAKGCGVLSHVGIPGMERMRTLSSSMEEADRPMVRRTSVNASPPPGAN